MRIQTHDYNKQTSVSVGLEENGNILFEINGNFSEIKMEDWHTIRLFIAQQEESREQRRKKENNWFRRNFNL